MRYSIFWTTCSANISSLDELITFLSGNLSNVIRMVQRNAYELITFLSGDLSNVITMVQRNAYGNKCSQFQNHLITMFIFLLTSCHSNKVNCVAWTVFEDMTSWPRQRKRTPVTTMYIIQKYMQLFYLLSRRNRYKLKVFILKYTVQAILHII